MTRVESQRHKKKSYCKICFVMQTHILVLRIKCISKGFNNIIEHVYG
jgi:hypothetical protein